MSNVPIESVHETQRDQKQRATGFTPVVHRDKPGGSPGSKRMRRAILTKEWIEHRWRFALGTVVLSTLLGGMIRAQVIPYNEAAIFVFWPVGTILTIFLAMGPVAAEKTGRTWEFLLAQPVPRFQILLGKWRMGLYELIAMNLITGCVGLLAMWSRNFYGRTGTWGWELGGTKDIKPEQLERIRGWLIMISDHPAVWLIILVIVATLALACWYTVLFFALTRARNEFTAALGGLLLTIVVHAWLVQMAFPWVRIPALLNPFATFVTVMFYPGFITRLPVMLLVHGLFWIGGTLLIARYALRRQSHV